MATEDRNVPLNVTLDQLKTAIRNAENAGFVLREMSITKGKEANRLVVEEGEPPSAQIQLQLLEAKDETAATTQRPCVRCDHWPSRERHSPTNFRPTSPMPKKVRVRPAS